MKNPSFFRPVWAEINHAALRSNFKKIKSIVGKKVDVLAVIKANAYGHGVVPVGQALSAAGAKLFGVTCVEEALELWSAGVRKTPALVLGNSFPFESLQPAIRHQIRVTVSSLDAARFCSRAAKRLNRKVYVHAKVDTGMHRIGVQVRNAVPFVRELSKLPNLVMEGIYTHFSGSAEDPKYTAKQLELFEGVVDALQAEGLRPKWVHCANSAAIVKYPDSHFTLVRPGIALYGTPAFARSSALALKPVLQWKSRIVFLKDVPAFSAISYAGTFVTRRPSRIATASFGYADGFRRSLSNNAFVLLRGHRVPVLGRVTMDMTMLDVTDVPGTEIGDELVLIGTQGNEQISAVEMGVWAQTSPYEILCGIAARVPRVHRSL